VVESIPPEMMITASFIYSVFNYGFNGFY